MPKLTDILVGKLALKHQLVTAPVLQRCAEEQRVNPSASLGQVLVRNRLVTSHQLVGLMHATERMELSCARCGGRYSPQSLDPDGELACPRCFSALRILFEGVEMSDRFATGQTARKLGKFLTPGALGAQQPDTRPDTGSASSRKLKLPHVKGDFSGMFGPYEILEELGRGGMGVVYKARQPHLDRFVALKILLAGQLASKTQVKRFQREAEVAARLKHPGIVQIHDVGQVGDYHYFTMDFIEGQPLSSLIKKRRLGLRRAVEVARDVARALDHAHQRGAVHRDVKPANVIVDADGQPVLTDFGLARDLEAAERDRLTRSGAVLGTPYYMAPEQAQGKREDVGPLTDLYSLGVVLYETLTFELPFRGETQLELTSKIVSEEPRRPTGIEPAIDRDVETIVLKCLAKRPSDRYASAGDMADDLDRYLRGEPILARRRSPIERVWRKVRGASGSAVLTAASLVAVAVLTYGVATYVQRPGGGGDVGGGDGPPATPTTPPVTPPTPPGPAPGVQAAADAVAAARRAATDALGAPAPRYREALEAQVLRATEALALNPDHVEMLLLRARGQAALRRFDPAFEDYRRVMALDPGGAAGAEATFRFALASLQRGGEGDADEAHALMEQTLAQGGPESVWRELLRALLAFDRDEDYPAALSALTRAEQLDPEEPQVHALQGLTLVNMQEPEAAVDHLERALRMNPKDATAWANLAQIRLVGGGGSKQRGLDDLERSLEIDPENDIALSLRASVNQARGRIAEAIEDLRVLLEHHPREVPLLLQLATLYNVDGRPQQADRLLERVREIDPNDPRPYTQRARRQLQVNDFRGALNELRRGLRITRDPGAAEQLLREFRRLATSTGQLDAAVAFAEDVLRDRPDDPDARLILAEAKILSSNDEPGGFALLEEILAEHPRHLPTWQFRLQVVWGERPQDEFERVFDRFLAAFPEDAEALAFAARMHAIARRDPQTAIRFAERALRIDPDDPDALTMLAFVASNTEGASRESLKQARRYLLQAVQADPRHVEAMSLLGATEFNLGNVERAESILMQAYDLDPFFESTLEGLAAVFAKTQRFEQCVRFGRRTLAMHEAARRPPPIPVVLILVDAHRALRQFEPAIGLLEGLTAQLPEPRLLYELAKTYAEAGRLDEARELAQRIVEEHPDFEPARRLLDQLGAG